MKNDPSVLLSLIIKTLLKDRIGIYKLKQNNHGSFVWLAAYTYKGQYKRSEQVSLTIIK